MVRDTVAAFGSLDLFVSNAVYSDRQLMVDADMKGFRRTIDVSMWGAFYGVRAASQQMLAQGKGGAITVVSSPHAIIPFPTAMAYNMSKAAIDHMARTAAIELVKHGIRVNVFHPGWIDTPGERKFFSEEQLEEGGRSMPMGRLGTSEEMAWGICFTLSEQGAYMTGSTLTMDGGLACRGGRSELKASSNGFGIERPQDDRYTSIPSGVSSPQCGSGARILRRFAAVSRRAERRRLGGL